MTVNPTFTITISAGVPYYRVTSKGHWTKAAAGHKKVVDGQGALKNSAGARYNFPGAVTVYLAETIETCLAEKMFYFHREVLRSLDTVHRGVPVPAFAQQFALWEVIFKKDIPAVCDLTIARAPAYFGVFSALMTNPSQDYDHLKQRRADIQALGYSGIRAPSSRSTLGGNMVVLFSDQSKNVQSITPFALECRLMTPPPGSVPFVSHATDMLDYSSGEARILGAPSSMVTYSSFTAVAFNH